MCLKVCDYCGKEFEAPRGNYHYCSDGCRAKAKTDIRAKWVIDSDYTRKQREARRVERSQKREERMQEKENKRRKQSEELKEASIRNRERLQERADSGDCLAIMLLCNNTSLEYWRAYQKYEMEIAKENKTRRDRLVNEISIREKDFAEKVVESIHKTGVIKTCLY